MDNVTSFSLKLLSLCVSLALLSGCGGSGSDHNAADTQEVAPAAPIARMAMLRAGSHYPEPNKDIPDEATLGFYDTDQDGNPRSIRNDLTGNFAAMIQFAQDHTVDPSGNEAKYMPRLTSEKDGLLLVTPTADMGDIQQLNAEIYLNSRLMRRIALQEPAQIPASDQSNSDNRAPIQYSKRAWTAALKWDEIKPGLNIRIVDPVSRKNGRILASEIDFAPPAELLVQSIRLGLLTAPPSGQYYFLNNPEKAGTDYLQTIPAAQITVSRYEDMVLSKVMVASGKIYDTVSDTTGDVYSGDMRENTAKSTVSTGINLANWGITSAGMASQQQPQLTQSVVIHHARGKYQNGDATHGLSGGNGILTLYDSLGNEFSHEIGHHYGLGHYPGQNGDNYFWSSHHQESGWGYIAYRNRMRGNLNWNVSDTNNRLNGTPVFQNQYVYATDAMAGGNFSSSLSRYTHYTGYSTQQKIQPALNRAVWDAGSPTGYKQWNANTRQMENIQPKVPKSDQVWYNRADGNYLKPAQFGVPVLTILGGYDPVAHVGLLYPAARGNWGNVFNLPQANPNTADASCWVHVSFANKAAQNIALAPMRMGSNANKLHINLAQSDHPQHADLYCKKAGEAAVKLSEIDIPTYATPLPEAVIVGKARSFNALRKVELPQLEQALLSNQNKAMVSLSPDAKVLYDTYKDAASELSVAAQNELQRYSEQDSKLFRLNRWVNVYRADLSAEKSEAVSAFKAFAAQLGLSHEQPLANASQLRLAQKGNVCLKADQLSTGKFEVYISGVNGCNSLNSQWLYDAMGKLHNRQYPNQCLGSAITLVGCNNEDAGQVWSLNPATKAIHQGNQCIDLNGGFTPGADGRATAIRYSCTGSANQQWTLPAQNQSLILAAAQAKNLLLMVKSLQP